MLFLFFTVLLNALISAFLKWMDTYKLDALQVIVCNYWVCVLSGSLFIGQSPFHLEDIGQPWFPWAILMGAAFIALFNLMAFITRVDGITSTTIANKLSLVIPVAFSVLLYKETLGLFKIMGIILAFPAVYLTVHVGSAKQVLKNLWAPLILFAGSGLLDTLVNYTQYRFLPDGHSQGFFLVHAFAAAGIIGLAVMLYRSVFGGIAWQRRSIVWGLLLGVPNYFSIYFLMRFLHSGFMQSAVAIPVNNLSIVVFTTLMALLLFKEQMTRLRFMGLILSVLAILLIALGH
jgi:drug/metabolite transporter (DMT)-like permease